MLNARNIQRSAIICGLVCALVASAMSGTAAARPTHATAVAAALAQERYYTSYAEPRATDAAPSAARAQERYYTSYGKPMPLIVTRRRPRRRHRGRRSPWPSPPRSPSPPQARPHSAASASASAAARPKSPASNNNHRCPPDPTRRAPASSRIPLLLKHPAAAQQETRDVELPTPVHRGRATADRLPTSPAPKHHPRRPLAKPDSPTAVATHARFRYRPECLRRRSAHARSGRRASVPADGGIAIAVCARSDARRRAACNSAPVAQRRGVQLIDGVRMTGWSQVR